MDDEKTVLLTKESNEESKTQSEENMINNNLIWKSPRFIIAAGLCLIAVIVAITIIITSAGGEDDDIAYKLKTAQKYLTEMKYEEAKALFEEIIESDPMCEEAYIGLADVYVGLGDEDKAVEILKEGLDKVEKSVELKKKLEKLEWDKSAEDKETKIDEKLTTDTFTEPEGDVTTEDSEGTEEQITTTEERSNAYNEETRTTQSTASQQQTTIKKTEVETQQQPTTKTQSTTETISYDNDERKTLNEANESDEEFETTGNTDVVKYENTIICDMWFDNFSEAYEIDEEGIELTFNSKTFDTIDVSSRYYWDTPLYIIHYEDDYYWNNYWLGEFRFIGRSDLFGWIPVFDGKEESDGFEWINTQDGEMFTDCGYTYETEGSPESEESWIEWFEANKTGVICTLKAVKTGDKVTVEFTNNGVTSKATIPVDGSRKVFVTISGEKCTIGI